MSWTAFDQPNQIASGSTTGTFSYDGNNRRVIDTTVASGTTSKKYYIDDGFEQFVSPGTVETRMYVNAPSGAVVVRALLEKDAGVVVAGTAQASHEELEYYHWDNLGSVYLVTDPTGTPIDQFTFDPWGLRTVTSQTGGTFALNTDHGYTGHEMLDAFALIHMNGRVFDPTIGRMLSADPVRQQPLNPQDYNRYSYVLNNPLSKSDPTGYVIVGMGAPVLQTTTRSLTIEATFTSILVIGQGPAQQDIFSAQGSLETDWTQRWKMDTSS